MAVRSNIQYLAHMVLRELGLGTFLPFAVGAGSTSMRVLDASLFDPGGGQLMVEANDNLVTYDYIENDVLKGIPASGDGSITSNLISVATGSTRSLVYVPHFVSYIDLEKALDRYRVRMVQSCFPDPAYLVYSSARGFWSTDLAIHDDPGDNYNVLTASSFDYENGRATFSAARTETELWLFGEGFNPWHTIIDLILNLAQDGRWNRYQSHGSSAVAKQDAGDLAKTYAGRASSLELITG